MSNPWAPVGRPPVAAPLFTCNSLMRKAAMPRASLILTGGGSNLSRQDKRMGGDLSPIHCWGTDRQGHARCLGSTHEEAMADINADRMIAHLRDKWKGRNCPLCGEGGWQVQDKAFELREFHGCTMVLGGPVIPLIPITCSNCGNTVLVNAISAGVLDREKGGK